jgi:hypothetical protein
MYSNGLTLAGFQMAWNTTILDCFINRTSYKNFFLLYKMVKSNLTILDTNCVPKMTFQIPDSLVF